MAVTIYEQNNYNCELASIDVYFEYGNSAVFCTGEKTISQKGIESFSCARLTVISKCLIEQYQGPSTHQKMFMWPLSPFFNLAKDSYNNIEFMYFLIAAMISKYVGMQCWQEEWNETKKFLMPPRRTIRAFLKGELTVEKDSLVDGREYNISWKALFNYYVKNPKKETRRELESVIEDMFINTSVNEENAPDIFNMSIILADSEKKEIKQEQKEPDKLSDPLCKEGI